jgi:hypothetical protein
MFRKTAGGSNLNWVILTLLLVMVLCQVSWAQGDNLWNIRENSDDRFHDNTPWLRPWRYNYDDGVGQWIGYWSYEVPWGGVSTIGGSDGSFSIGRDRDHQFHAWTYVRVETAQTISLYGAGDCVPRAFVNYAFDSPIEFPGNHASLSLISGWNRIDITGYNQNSPYTFTCGALANLVDIMNSEEASPPIADADGPYVADEGTPVIFDGSGSSDPDGDPLEYRWDFQDDGIWDTPWSFDPTAEHTYGDNWSGQARVEVSDGAMTDTDTAPVTIHNVAPNVQIDFVNQSNPNFILPHHTLTFGGSFSDPGWLDVHASLWNFDNGTTAPGILVEENNQPDATGVAIVQYAYPQPGIYSVTLTITDGDGGNGVSAAWIVTVLTPGQGVQTLDDYFQGLDAEDFKNNASQRKKALHNSLQAVIDLINAGEIQEAIDKLQNDIRAKADGSLGGNPNNDWIMDPAAQQDICSMIDDIIADLQLLLL